MAKLSYYLSVKLYQALEQQEQTKKPSEAFMAGAEQTKKPSEAFMAGAA